MQFNGTFTRFDNELAYSEENFIHIDGLTLSDVHFTYPYNTAPVKVPDRISIPLFFIYIDSDSTLSEDQSTTLSSSLSQTENYFPNRAVSFTTLEASAGKLKFNLPS
jgi:hypothetical protein